MNKTKQTQTQVKKTLVRNPEQPMPRAVTVTQSKLLQKCTTDASSSNRDKVSTTSSGSPKKNVSLKSKFSTPEMYSTLKLSKKIDEVVQPRKTKSLSDVDKNKLAVDEKVSRKVNFPYGQSVFKDLIPLTNNEVKSQQILSARGPMLPKDKEPVLSDYLEPRKPKVYYHLPSCRFKPSEESRLSISAADSLKLYKIIRISEDND